MKAIFKKLLGDKKFPADYSRPSEGDIKQALSTIVDPDLNKDIVTLGFVRNIDITDHPNGTEVRFSINLTTPACPIKEKFKSDAKSAVKKLPGVSKVTVEMTADTPSLKATGSALSGIKNIIAVASGKGGVGKSTTAVNLAYALSKSGSKVGILDADITGPSIPKMTGALNPEKMEGDLVVPPVKDGVKIISCSMFKTDGSANILRGPMASNLVTQFFKQVKWGALDYLIIDYPPGTSDIQLTISQVANVTAAVLVTTPQEVSCQDCDKAAQMFSTLNVPVIGVIETMSYFQPKPHEKYFIFGSGAAKTISLRFGIPILGEIPIEQSVSEMSDKGLPIVSANPNSLAAVAYSNAAGQIARYLSIMHFEQKAALESFRLKWRSN